MGNLEQKWAAEGSGTRDREQLPSGWKPRLAARGRHFAAEEATSERVNDDPRWLRELASCHPFPFPQDLRWWREMK